MDGSSILAPAAHRYAPGGQDRWLGVGQSHDHDPGRAGDAAAADALAGREAGTAKLLLVFCTAAYDLGALLAGVNERSGGVPLIGCSTAGEIATTGPGDAGVVVIALGGEGFSVATACSTRASTRLREAGAEVAACVEQTEDRPYGVLLMLSDGLAGDQQEIVRGAYSVVGSGLPLVGGCAGDDLKMRATFQLHGNRVLSDGVVAAALRSDAPLGIGVHHGWSRVGDPMLVTRSANNRVYTLNDEPALEAYLRRLDPPAEAHRDAEAFTRFALTHPLGLARRSGEDHVRFIGGADFRDGSLGCIAEIPQGGLAWLMEGNRASVLQAAEMACAQALAPLQGRPPLGVIAFDCIARRGVLGEAGIRREVEIIAERAGGAPVAGFYTYGEIARTHGVSGFHNQTLVVLAVS